MIRQYCKDCHWWEDSAEKCGQSVMAEPVDPNIGNPARLGTCHKDHHFERTREDDWCGEFTPKTP